MKKFASCLIAISLALCLSACSPPPQSAPSTPVPPTLSPEPITNLFVDPVPPVSFPDIESLQEQVLIAWEEEESSDYHMVSQITYLLVPTQVPKDYALYLIDVHLTHIDLHYAKTDILNSEDPDALNRAQFNAETYLFRMYRGYNPHFDLNSIDMQNGLAFDEANRTVYWQQNERLLSLRVPASGGENISRAYLQSLAAATLLELR